jgi:putative hydrolase of the HAD superfamily
MTINALFFDLDDTLLWDKKSVEEAFAATCKVAHERFGINVEDLEHAVREEARALYASYETYPYTQMIGINPFEGLWGDFIDEQEDLKKLSEIAPSYRCEAWTRGLMKMGKDNPEFGCELGGRFQINRKNLPFVYDDTYSTLDKLKNQYKLVLLTNGSPDLQNTKLRMSPELITYFSHIVISGDFGKGKPDPSIFEHALSLSSVKKEEVLMIGDNLNTDILGANRSGIQSVWINRHHMKNSSAAVPTYEIHYLEELFGILAHHS